MINIADLILGGMPAEGVPASHPGGSSEASSGFTSILGRFLLAGSADGEKFGELALPPVGGRTAGPVQTGRAKDGPEAADTTVPVRPPYVFAPELPLGPGQSTSPHAAQKVIPEVDFLRLPGFEPPAAPEAKFTQVRSPETANLGHLVAPASGAAAETDGESLSLTNAGKPAAKADTRPGLFNAPVVPLTGNPEFLEGTDVAADKPALKNSPVEQPQMPARAVPDMNPDLTGQGRRVSTLVFAERAGEPAAGTPVDTEFSFTGQTEEAFRPKHQDAPRYSYNLKSSTTAAGISTISSTSTTAPPYVLTSGRTVLQSADQRGEQSDRPSTGSRTGLSTGTPAGNPRPIPLGDYGPGTKPRMYDRRVTQEMKEAAAGVRVLRPGLESAVRVEAVVETVVSNNIAAAGAAPAESANALETYSGTARTAQGKEDVGPAVGREVSGFLDKLKAPADEHYARIRIHPPELGDVAINVRVKEKLIMMELTVENREVKQLLDTHLSAFKAELADRGFTLEHFNVEMSNNTRTSGNPHHNPELQTGGLPDPVEIDNNVPDPKVLQILTGNRVNLLA